MQRRNEVGKPEIPATEVMIEREVHKAVVAEVEAIWRYDEPGSEVGEYEMEFRSLR